MAAVIIDPELPRSDILLLHNLDADIQRHQKGRPLSSEEGKDASPQNGAGEQLSGANGQKGADGTAAAQSFTDERVLAQMKGLNDPSHPDFEPTVFSSWDLKDLSVKLHPAVSRYLLLPYIEWARKTARHETDVVMITHLIIYFTTSIPSAIWLFYRFSYWHAIIHTPLQFWYMGVYTLMMHQHIHQRGILSKEKAWTRIFDLLFPYATDPLMGHTWNSYFYHHVKHHHVEGNGPDDLSSTVRYQRDNIWHFLHYVGRFYFLIWLDLPLYFLGKNRYTTALKAAFWELGTYAAIATLYHLNSRATTFVFILPLMLMRLGLMIGNWGQHAFVDADEPDSDYRSSITLIDVPSNRFCYNDGYHISHHLNPLRHWREHPVHFLQNKETYSREHSLVFHNIDYLMITVRLMMRDYEHLAKCLVPIGDQIDLTLEERATMLKRHTRRFSEEEIKQKFGVAKSN
ncbi:hypothetical protein SLS62_007122 [Diatrype stigma]|uniref:Fatty acid desaturase domain-containing protein n=1 Tax=Diatrype stigma TaxID=117547 RepID=A0AAN9UXF3_9PEZI